MEEMEEMMKVEEEVEGEVGAPPGGCGGTVGHCGGTTARQDRGH